MGKVYVLIDNGWDTIGESYAETELCIGVFTSPESVTKAANDYLAHRLNTISDFEKNILKYQRYLSLLNSFHFQMMLLMSIIIILAIMEQIYMFMNMN